MFALVLASILKKQNPMVRIYRAIFYLPSLLGASVAIALLWRQIFNRDGVLNRFLYAAFGYEGINWIGTPDTALYTLIILAIWQFGASMVIFLGGLKQISPDYYEAAEIDGAGKIQSFFKITIPLLTPMVFFNIVMTVIGAFQAFTSAFIVSGGSGGPVDSTMFYTLYLYIRAFTQFNMGYASAMAWVLLVIIAVLTRLMFMAANKWVYYDE
jgi:multiple sugar transport system permease protein